MLSPANTPSTYTSEYVCHQLEFPLSFYGASAKTTSHPKKRQEQWKYPMKETRKIPHASFMKSTRMALLPPSHHHHNHPPVSLSKHLGRKTDNTLCEKRSTGLRSKSAPPAPSRRSRNSPPLPWYALFHFLSLSLFSQPILPPFSPTPPSSAQSSLKLTSPKGNPRRPPRPPTEQKSLGIRHQRRPLSPARAHLEKAKRRRRRQGEVVFVRAGGECQGARGEGVDDGGG